MQKRIGTDMTIQQMLADLLKVGFSQRAIADRVGATQPTICRAMKGADIRYETGKAIERMHADAVNDQKTAA